jgi:penicillin-binding protein 1A
VLFRRREKKPRTRRVRKLRLLALLSVLGLVCGVAFVYGLVTAVASEIPKLDPIRQTALEQDGFIYASDGKTVLTRLRGSESRVLVESKEINPWMKHAIVAVEDRRFWEHRGVDVRGIGRALWADVRHKELVQGGSTITQQFVKNSLRRDDRTIARKLKEAALAWQLERRWSKDRILTSYLNTVFFGNGAYGVQMAARVYFNKKARDLTLAEAALLAGVPANPSLYNPVSNPRTARARRSTVLRLMYEQKMITAGELAAADHAPLPKPESVHLPGSRGPAAFFTEYVKQQLIDTYGAAEVFGGGLHVTTSIDLGLQDMARNVVNQWLGERGMPSAALVAIDPRDGRVLAMYGGSSFRESQFNLAVQGERQPGSSFKPFVLATALNQGISPQTTFTSAPQLISLGDKLWSVHNYEGAYLGRIDLNDATTHSDNAVYAQLTALVGPKNVAAMAHRLGVTSPLNSYLGIGLGVEAVNPLEMARAFSSFANGGKRVDGRILGNRPRAVLEIEHDNETEVNAPVQQEVLPANTNAMVTSMLEDVVESGTGIRAGLDDRPAAGKTGTTENYGDAWFVGYTPQLAVAVWVGYPNKLIPMTNQFQGGPVAGGTFPALIWKTFVTRALRSMDEEPESFPAPEYQSASPVSVVYRDDKWLVDNGNCRNAREVLYVSGFAPQKVAPCKPNEVDVPHVVGAKLDDAETRLVGMPLTPDVITRPAKPGERLGIVVAQFPKSGTLSSWATVRIVVPKATHGKVPNLVGKTLQEARTILLKRGLVPVVEFGTARSEEAVVRAQLPRAGVAGGKGLEVHLRIGPR